MKKAISLLLALIMCLYSCCSICFAADTEDAFCCVSWAQELFGMLTSVFARGINLITGTDESKITAAEVQEHSWAAADEGDIPQSCENEMQARVWTVNELTFVSQSSYGDSFNDVTLDLTLTGNGRKYTVPGFWDGENIWKVRFVCPSQGVWYYTTVCSDIENTALHNRTGKIVCSEYTGEYDIYKNGFVTTNYAQKYFTYDNGVPFLYLGDTHWSLGDETTEIITAVCEKRSSQGFTVIQSEPIGAKFDVTDGITDADMAGFADYDEKFKIIADYGLVHANAEFFYPYYINKIIDNFGGYGSEYTQVKLEGKNVKVYQLNDTVKAYLERLTRYWVARYGAYPVLWTLGQEVDNDFYWASDSHPQWGYANNPYKLIAEYIDKYDCYDHPVTAHQENAGATGAYGNGDTATDSCKVYNKNASASAFRDVKVHSWYAAQWSPSKTKQLDFNIARDYWYNSQGKPAVNYEGAYCGLWTKNFGSRMQGWCAYLNGMYGYGWGGHDTWSYLNVYDEDNDSSDGVDTITSQEKKDATWRDSLEYESGYQCGYMLDFLKTVEWYQLIPRFDNKAYFTPALNVLYSYASNTDNSDIVIYFYSFSDDTVAQKPNATGVSAISTGTVGMLDSKGEYAYEWFNPITGEYMQKGSFSPTAAGTYYIGKKPSTDAVLHIYRQSGDDSLIDDIMF